MSSIEKAIEELAKRQAKLAQKRNENDEDTVVPEVQEQPLIPEKLRSRTLSEDMPEATINAFEEYDRHKKDGSSGEEVEPAEQHVSKDSVIETAQLHDDDHEERVDTTVAEQAHASGEPDAEGFAESLSEPANRSEKKRSGRLKIDQDALKAYGLVTPDQDRSLAAEEYRRIKRPLLMNAFGRGAALVENGNLIMVTSSRPGEGKTHTAFNLSLSIAMERDSTVLLVDADVGRSTISRMLGIGDRQGLIDVLLDPSIGLPDVMLKSNIPSLRVLPAGSRHHHATELLGSTAMRDLMQELSLRYPDRIVIFDSPPLLLTNEAPVLAELMGQIVMVVEAESTSRSLVHDALSLLNPDKAIGLVLNKSHNLFNSGNYGYYY